MSIFRYLNNKLTKAVKWFLTALRVAGSTVALFMMLNVFFYLVLGKTYIITPEGFWFNFFELVLFGFIFILEFMELIKFIRR